MKRRRRFPWTRLGLLLVVGSVFASLIRWYVAFGASLADLDADVSTQRADMGRDFLANFLFGGTVPGVLFWAGIAAIGIGIVRNLRAPRA